MAIVTSWFHAVTFDRPHSAADEQLARELLLEWAEARGLSWLKMAAEDVGGTVAGVVAVMELLGIPPRVLVERDNYGQWAGYAMEFTPTARALLSDAHDGYAAMWGQSRLKEVGRRGGMLLRGLEEHYTPPTKEGEA